MCPYIDYHMHTPLCGHAKGEPEEYARQAIKMGLKEIGFSDHAPLVSHEDPAITMSMSQLPQYHAMIEKVQKKFLGKIEIKIGLEADFIPGFEKKTKEIIDAYPYDYVYGSIHFIGHWGFDNPSELAKWKEADVDEVYQDYYALLRQAAQSKLFDVMAHVDLVKKYGYRASKNLKQELKKTAKVFKDCGVAVEINTSGLRKPVKEIYPSLDVLTAYQKAGVSLVFGSDAHDPKDVGRDFDKGLALAKAAGYGEYVAFSERKIVARIKI